MPLCLAAQRLKLHSPISLSSGFLLYISSQPQLLLPVLLLQSLNLLLLPPNLLFESPEVGVGVGVENHLSVMFEELVLRISASVISCGLSWLTTFKMALPS